MGVSDVIGTATSWVNVVDGGATAGSFGAMGTGGGCMIWNVGCSDSSDAGGSDTFAGSDTSARGIGGGSDDWGTSGNATGAGNDSTCILFEQYEYLK